MPKESSLATREQFLGSYADLLAKMRVEAVCARWGLSLGVFAEWLRRSAEKRFGGAAPDARGMEGYLGSLHLEDLALACACCEGIESAWEFFVAHFRQDLRHAASAMLRSPASAGGARAEELADSLYAELYGIRSNANGPRKSLFEYFHGRSKLSTWLRAVLAQRHVDQVRTAARTVSLDAESQEEGVRGATRLDNSAPPDPERERYVACVDRALVESLAEMAPRERLILASYYVDRLTLAQIGKVLREHESTVSRQLERIRETLRERITDSLKRGTPPGDGLAAKPGLDDAQIELAFEYALEDWGFDLSQALSAADRGSGLRE